VCVCIRVCCVHVCGGAEEERQWRARARAR